MTFKLF